MEYNDENKLEIKVVILGCSSSGKTSIVNRYIGNAFDGNSPPTYGTTHFIKEIKIEDKSIIFNIWDTLLLKDISLQINILLNLQMLLF